MLEEQFFQKSIEELENNFEPTHNLIIKFKSDLYDFIEVFVFF